VVGKGAWAALASNPFAPNKKTARNHFTVNPILKSAGDVSLARSQYLPGSGLEQVFPT
jgi:hypothetical protein